MNEWMTVGYWLMIVGICLGVTSWCLYAIGLVMVAIDSTLKLKYGSSGRKRQSMQSRIRMK